MEYELIHTFDFIVTDYFLPAVLSSLGTAFVLMFIVWGMFKLISFFRTLMN